MDSRRTSELRSNLQKNSERYAPRSRRERAEPNSDKPRCLQPSNHPQEYSHQMKYSNQLFSEQPQTKARHKNADSRTTTLCSRNFERPQEPAIPVRSPANIFPQSIRDGYSNARCKSGCKIPNFPINSFIIHQHTHW